MQFDISAILNLASVIAALLSAIAALFAVRLAIAGIDMQKRLATASVRPLLTVETVDLPDRREISLLNTGLGTAMRVDPTFTKGTHESKTGIPEILDIPFSFDYDWDMHFDDREGSHLRAGGRWTLIRLTREYLGKQGLTPDTVDLIFKAYDKQVTGLKIAISYEDLFEKKQKEYRVTC
jgi:hypothetical protein